MQELIDKIHKNVLNVLFPNFCNGCEKLLLKNEKVLCTSCCQNLPKTFFHLNTNNDMMQKFYGLLDLQYATAFLFFRKKNITQNLIHNLKYKRQEAIGEFIANMYSYDLKDVNWLSEIDYILPVPLHKKRLFSRGYNQVSLFAKTLANNFNIDFNEHLLLRVKHQTTQTKKSKENRILALQNSFKVQNIETFENKHILIIDDVFTTGATIEACYKAIIKIPNVKISVLTMAYSNS